MDLFEGVICLSYPLSRIIYSVRTCPGMEEYNVVFYLY